MAKNVRLDKSKLERLTNMAAKQVAQQIVRDGVDYGAYQEFGTSTVPAQPFLGPAFERHIKRLPELIGEKIEKIEDLSGALEEIMEDVLQQARRDAPVDSGDLKDSLERVQNANLRP